MYMSDKLHNPNKEFIIRSQNQIHSNSDVTCKIAQLPITNGSLHSSAKRTHTHTQRKLIQTHTYNT